MKKQILFVFLSILTMNSILSAEQNEVEIQNNMQYLKVLDPKNAAAIRQLHGDNIKIDRIMSGDIDMNVSYRTKIVPITSTIQKLELHPTKLTKIYLPEGSKIISEPSTTTPLKIFSYAMNRIKLQPKSDFNSTNIDIIFEYKKKKYDLTIFANKYDVSKANYIDNKFYPKIAFKLYRELKPVEALKKYKDQYREYPKDKKTYFSNKGIGYVINKVNIGMPTNASVIEPISGKLLRYYVESGISEL